MSNGLNEAWLAEILDEDEVSLSRETFDDIVNRLNEQDEKIRKSAEERAVLLAAAQRVIAHRVGDLPNRGDLRDNDTSRRDIAELAAAIRTCTGGGA